jgi:hypothetical protein
MMKKYPGAVIVEIAGDNLNPILMGAKVLEYILV